MDDKNINNLESDVCQIRVLVVIASYGMKNIDFLKKLIRSYQGMAMNTDVVVVSDGPKDCGPDVRVVVGLPSKNPWSLPFAHKRIFAENMDRYDLFVYSEDDMEVTENNIQAFLSVTPYLAEDEIAGFLRYEVDESGKWSFPEAHGVYHWKPGSVKQRGNYTIAEFTNEHSAFYLLTQAQLKKVIASGGFLREPYEGRYDMLCSAATDPYTSCGFKKVICISAIENFLIHHLSNRYAGVLGVSLPDFMEQIRMLMAIAKDIHPATRLCKAESYLSNGEWSKNYYETPNEDLIKFVPDHIGKVLSIGCGWGATEAKLKDRGASVTAIPMDSVIAAKSASLGIDMVYGSLDECLAQLEGQVFDCLLMTNLLHLLPNPGQVLEQCSHFIGRGGAFIISGPNFSCVRVLAKRLLGIKDYRKLGNFEESGIHLIGPMQVKRYLKKADLDITKVQWVNHLPVHGIERKLGRFGASNWLLKACR